MSRLMDSADRVLPGDAASNRVTGLAVRPRSGGSEHTVAADLIVDASGRGSQSPKWLQEWGFGSPDISEVRDLTTIEEVPPAPVVETGTTWLEEMGTTWPGWFALVTVGVAAAVEGCAVGCVAQAATVRAKPAPRSSCLSMRITSAFKVCASSNDLKGLGLT